MNAFEGAGFGTYTYTPSQPELDRVAGFIELVQTASIAELRTYISIARQRLLMRYEQQQGVSDDR